MTQIEIEQILLENPQLRSKLFARGFLVTDASLDDQGYPFYGNWSRFGFGPYRIYTAQGMNCYIASAAHASIALVGHAYNPFSMECQEHMMLEVLLRRISEGETSFWDAISELTGVFTLFVIRNRVLSVIGDASGMLTTFYTVHAGNTFISSHTNLIGDLLNLKWDPYIQELVGYRFFKLLGNSLPGDLTQFREVRRLVPNHYISIERGEAKSHRFYWPRKLNVTRDVIVEKVSSLLRSNMELIAKKWDRPAISLTGGCDSKTTLACAKGLYDQFRYFSYVSSEAEAVDADAANRICTALDLRHTIYRIPEEDSGLPDVETARELINWNTGNIWYGHPNEIRKRVFFADTKDFDVEVKSWASEIGRAYYSKRFNGRTDFGNAPSPRKCTTLYKFFLHNRKLVRETDRVFADYLKQFFEMAKENPIEWQDQFFWEFRVPSWNGIVITGEHRYSFDITIPYNNRRLIELLLSAPLEDRIADRVYTEIREKMNPAIDETGVSITNLKHTDKRAIIESLYYSVHITMFI